MRARNLITNIIIIIIHVPAILCKICDNDLLYLLFNLDHFCRLLYITR